MSPSVLPGSYLAYRIDHLRFNEQDNTSWDNNVLRSSLAFGYTITPNFLIRLAVSTQHVDNKDWDEQQRTFRLVLTAHY